MLVWDGWEWVDGGPGSSSDSLEAAREARWRLAGGPRPTAGQPASFLYGGYEEDDYDFDAMAFAAIKGNGLGLDLRNLSAIASEFDLDYDVD